MCILMIIETSNVLCVMRWKDGYCTRMALPDVLAYGFEISSSECDKRWRLLSERIRWNTFGVSGPFFQKYRYFWDGHLGYGGIDKDIQVMYVSWRFSMDPLLKWLRRHISALSLLYLHLCTSQVKHANCRIPNERGLINRQICTFFFIFDKWCIFGFSQTIISSYTFYLENN